MTTGTPGSRQDEVAWTLDEPCGSSREIALPGEGGLNGVSPVQLVGRYATSVLDELLELFHLLVSFEEVGQLGMGGQIRARFMVGGRSGDEEAHEHG